MPGKSYGQRGMVCNPWDHKKLALTEHLSHISVTRDNLQTVAHLTCVPCNGFSLVSKWNEMKSMSIYFKEILLSLSNMLRKFTLKRTILNGAVSQFSGSVMSDSLQPHGLQHNMLTCPSPTPGCYANSCPLSRWCHPVISSSVIPFSSRLQFSLASGSFPISWFFASGGKSIGVSASASVLPMNIQDWLLLGLTSRISLQCLP